MKVLVVGATGDLGRAASAGLLAGGHVVRAMTREPARASGLAELGAEVVTGDLVDPPSLERAVAGTDAVFAAAHSLLGRGRWSSAAVDDRGHRALVDAAARAGVRRFVYTSVLGAAPDHPIDFWRSKHGVERHLAASGLPHTVLRPSLFMERHAHAFLGGPLLESGKATILGRGETVANYVAVGDVARIAARALEEPEARNGVVPVGGPGNHSKNQVAELYLRLSGREARIRRLTPTTLRLLAALLGPVHPGLARVLRLGLLGDSRDLPFDAAATLAAYPVELTPLGSFVAERVAEWRRR
jgi:NADH dehydrogenase